MMSVAIVLSTGETGAACSNRGLVPDSDNGEFSEPSIEHAFRSTVQAIAIANLVVRNQRLAEYPEVVCPEEFDASGIPIPS